MILKSFSILILLLCINYTHGQPLFKILVFTKTSGFQHASITDGITAIENLGQQHNFDVDQTDDASFFTLTNLNSYAAVVFLNTTGDVLNGSEEIAFEQYIQSGGGFVGIHSATDTEYNWPWYGALVGSYFVNHPPVQIATLMIEDTTHLSTLNLPDPWIRTDEWYNFNVPFPSNLNVLLTIDESTYSGGTMGGFHPVSWYHYYDGGRSFYTSMGHTSVTYSEPEFLQHLLGGILWAANQSTPINDEDNEKTLFYIQSPVKDIIDINMPFSQTYEVKIFDTRGKIFLTEEFHKNVVLEVRNFIPGLYLINITGKNYEYRQKIIIYR